MTASKVINQQSFNDGRIVLYQLENRPKRLWLCRIKVPGGKGYVYRGTGSSDFYEARKFAEGLLEEFQLKLKLGQSITGHNLSKMVAEYETHIRAKGEPTKREQAIFAFLQTYAVPYFTKNKITEVTAAEISRFFDWRRVNSKRKAPRETTILHETSMLSTFLNWAHKRGLLDRKVELEKPKYDTDRRPHFDPKDWSKLTRFLREWVKQGINKSGPIHRDRLMLTNYVLILANTGIRVGEARGLRWMDVDTEPLIDGDGSNIVLHVNGKTGSREVVARTPEIKTYFERIWELRCQEIGAKPNREEAVFCHKDGKPIHSFKKGFNALLKEAGVEYDRSGDRRTVYSLRHTYATFRLHEGVNHYVLARNMGTSVKMLELHYGHTSNRAMADELTKHKERKREKLLWE
jgi:integrase